MSQKSNELELLKGLINPSRAAPKGHVVYSQEDLIPNKILVNKFYETCESVEELNIEKSLQNSEISIFLKL